MEHVASPIRISSFSQARGRFWINRALLCHEHDPAESGRSGGSWRWAGSATPTPPITSEPRYGEVHRGRHVHQHPRALTRFRERGRGEAFRQAGTSGRTGTATWSFTGPRQPDPARSEPLRRQDRDRGAGVGLCRRWSPGRIRSASQPGAQAGGHGPITAPRVLADMAQAIGEGRAHRCSMDLALHAVDVMTGILRSGETGGFVEMTTTCARPEALGPRSGPRAAGRHARSPLDGRGPACPTGGARPSLPSTFSGEQP